MQVNKSIQIKDMQMSFIGFWMIYKQIISWLLEFLWIQ